MEDDLNPMVIEGAEIEGVSNEEEQTSQLWAPTRSGPVGIPFSRSPQSVAGSRYTPFGHTPHSYAPSSVSSSYSRYSSSAAPPSGMSGPSRSFKARIKRDIPRESPSSRRSLLSSLLQQQSSAPQVPMVSNRSRRQSTASYASDSESSPFAPAAMWGPPDWKPPLPASLSQSSTTSSVNRTHVSISSIMLYGPWAAPRSIMPKIPQSASPEHIDLVTYDVSEMLKMIASVLKHILDTNDALYGPDAKGNPLPAPPVKTEEGSQMRTNLLSFHGCIIPAISQRAYLNRILKYCPLTNEVFLASLIYFDRISNYAHQCTVTGAPVAPGAAPAFFLLDSYNVHRLIIAAVTVASKFFSDIFYKNSRYAQVGGLPVDELNNLELQFLILIRFNLMVTAEDFQGYANYVQQFYAQYGGDE